MTLLYTIPQQEAFGFSIAVYFYLTGLSAGSFIISTLAYGFGFAQEVERPLAAFGQPAAPGALREFLLALLRIVIVARGVRPHRATAH